MEIITIKEHLEDLMRFSINENIRLLDEQWSVHADMEDSVQSVLDAISDTIHQASHGEIARGLSYYQGETSVIVFGKEINLYYVCYNASDQMVLKRAISSCEVINNFDTTSEELTLTIFMLNGNIIREYGENTIYHELEHILQYYKKLAVKPCFQSMMGDIYMLVSKILVSEGGVIETEDGGKRLITDNERLVAEILYYSHPREQDAFINEHYSYIKNYPWRFVWGQSPMRQLLHKFKMLVEEFEKRRQTSNFNSSIKNFVDMGCDGKNIHNIVGKGLSRFEKKLRNVEKQCMRFGATPQNSQT